MATTQNEVHIAITYVKSLHLPELPEVLPGIPRRLYAVVSVDDNIPYEMPSLDPKAFVSRPMIFLSKPSANLNIKLFAKRSRHADTLLAQTQVQVDTFDGDTDSEVPLTSSMDSQLKTFPILVLKITTSDRFADIAITESMRTSLEINPRLTKVFGYINLLVKIGSAISGLNPVAKAIMGLIEIANSKFEEILKRNKSVLQLLEAVGNASMLVVDWDNPELDDQRPHQQQVCRELVPEIYRCLHLLWTLSDGKHGKQLSQKSEEAVQARLTPLLALIKRMESNMQLDMQEVIFNISDKVTNLHDRACIDSLPYAKGVSASESKACLPNTRVALLERIQGWALNPTGDRTLLLHGAAGKGKSAVVHTVAITLETLNVAVVPFFAFNRSAKDRSLSQLIPTWAKQLAELNPQYLSYLHDLPLKRLQSLDILGQIDLVVNGLARIDDKMPLIFTIDALDECPAEDKDALFNILQKLLSNAELPDSVRFLFTFRPDKSITSSFGDLPSLSISIDDIEDTSTDIHTFVKDQLVRTDLKYMIDDVAKASQTLFQCAAVLCLELKRKQGPKLAFVRRDLLRKVRDTPGQPLYVTYRAILKMNFDERNVELMQLFRRVMSWIFLVWLPQPRKVLQAFAAELLPADEQSDVDEILDWLGSLLSGTMPGDNTPISPLHTSLRDFLLDSSESHAFSIELDCHSQEEIAWACLRIMNTGLKFNICELPTSFVLNSEIEDLPQRVKKHIPPELCYACLATAQHLRSALPPSAIINQHLNTAVVHGPSIKALVGIVHDILVYMSTSIVFLYLANVLKFFYHDQGNGFNIADELKFFLEHNFLYWLEAHSCMQTQQGGPGTMLPMFCEWAMSVGDEGLKTILLDYIKFEKRFREGYMLSAPQIYYSGLAFAPQDSLVPQLYSSLFHNLITVSGDLDIVWPPSEPLVIHGLSSVKAVAFSPDGTHIVSGSVDRMVRVWSAVTGLQVGETLRGHEGWVRSVIFSPDGTQIVSGSDDGTIRVWDTVTGKQVGSALRGHEGQVYSIAFSSDGAHIVSGSDDKTIRVWNAETGQQIGEALRGHEGSVYSVVFSPDSTLIVSGSEDKTVRMWDAVTRQQVGETLRHESEVHSIAFSPDGTHIVSGSEDIRVWNVTRQQVDNLKALKEYYGLCGLVSSVAFSPDGTYIVSTSIDNTIRVWDMVSGNLVGKAMTLRGHKDWACSVMFSPDSTCIVSGSDDETIRVWDIKGQQVVEALKGHENQVCSVAISPDGTHIVSGSKDGMIRVWDAVTGHQVGSTLRGPKGWVCSVMFSPDGTRIVSGSNDSIRIWDAVTGQQVAQGKDIGWVRSVAFSPDGTHIISGSNDKMIRVWDAVTGQQVGEPLRGHEDWVRSVMFSPDGRLIVSGSDDKTVRIWDAVTWQQVGSALRGHEDWVHSAIFSPDGTHIVSGSDDIRVWNAATGQQIGKALRGCTGLIYSVAFSPDGTYIASAYIDKTIRVWDIVTGQQVGKALRGHKNPVNSVAFSPDGTHIVSGSDNIRVWDVVKGVNTHPTWPQYHGDWFRFGKKEAQSYILWIPHPLRHRDFILDPCNMVITEGPKITVQFEKAAWGSDWAKIKK